MTAVARPSRTVNALLWTLQILLAALFGAGSVYALFFAPKDQFMPPAIMAHAWIGSAVAVVELAGALGLILPRLTGIRPRLTSWAALGLLLLMVGATGLHLGSENAEFAAQAPVPLAVGVLCGLVAWGRR